jgi:hypothetical protein
MVVVIRVKAKRRTRDARYKAITTDFTLYVILCIVLIVQCVITSRLHVEMNDQSIN